MFADTYAKAVGQRNQNSDFHKGKPRAPETQGKNPGADRSPEKYLFFQKPNKYQNNDSWR